QGPRRHVPEGSARHTGRARQRRGLQLSWDLGRRSGLEGRQDHDHHALPERQGREQAHVARRQEGLPAEGRGRESARAGKTVNGSRTSCCCERSEAGDDSGLPPKVIKLGRTYTVTYRVSNKSGNARLVSGNVAVAYSQ